MTKKETFIKEIELLINDALNCQEMLFEGLSKDAFEYFDKIKTTEQTKSLKSELTENGARILKYMQENCQKYNNIFKAKEIGEGLFISSHSVSGSMKKLIIEGFVEKIGSDPVTYSITNKGKEKNLNNI